LYTRIVNPDEHAKGFGEERWQELLRRLRSHIGKEIEWFRGREVDMVGDRPLAIFDGPARAIRAASAINEYASRLQIPMRCGLHTGECEMSDGKVTGLATEICLQISNQAGPHEVLVSNTVKDLVAGSGIRFTEKGTHTLAGVPGEWQLFAVERLSR
jgi:class 3 adenylate cyclase